MDVFTYISLGLWLVSAYLHGLVGRWLGRRRGQARVGFWLGFVLGLLGWLIVVVCWRKQRRVRLASSPELNAAQLAAVSEYYRTAASGVAAPAASWEPPSAR